MSSQSFPKMKPETREIQFIQSENFKSEYITGVFGARASSGTLSVNFFRDKPEIAAKMTADVIDGKLNSNKIQHTNKIKREIFFEGLMDIGTAKLIVDWLLTKIAENDLREV